MRQSEVCKSDPKHKNRGQVILFSLLCEEDVVALVAPVGEVVGEVCENDAGESDHGVLLNIGGWNVNE